MFLDSVQNIISKVRQMFNIDDKKTSNSMKLLDVGQNSIDLEEVTLPCNFILNNSITISCD